MLAASGAEIKFAIARAPSPPREARALPRISAETTDATAELTSCVINVFGTAVTPRSTTAELLLLKAYPRLLRDLPDVDELREIGQEIASGMQQHERDQIFCSCPHHAK